MYVDVWSLCQNLVFSGTKGRTFFVKCQLYENEFKANVMKGKWFNNRFCYLTWKSNEKFVLEIVI